MVVFNTSGSEVNAKIVYYGPALGGKTTNLEHIYRQMPTDVKGKMVSMKTRTDRTLFFDFLPLQLGDVNGYRTRILLYTVPGQVYYNATRKLVLKGADAVVFVADSDPAKHEENIDSLRNLEENLNELGLTLDTTPWVIQFNKRDLPAAAPIRTLESELNLLDVPSFEAIASRGIGVYETFQGIAGMLYNRLTERLDPRRPEVAGQPPTASALSAAPPANVDRSVFDAVEDALREAPVSAASAPPTQVHPAETPPLAAKAEPRVEAAASGAPEPVAPRRPVSETAEAPVAPAESESRTVEKAHVEPARRAPVSSSATATEDDTFRFAPLEAKKMDDIVGEVIDLEETENAVPAPPDGRESEFITDPRRSEAAAADSGEIAEIISSAEDVNLNEQSASMDDECVITVPVLLSRAQIRKTIPIKLRLEVQIIDDDLY